MWNNKVSRYKETQWFKKWWSNLNRINSPTGNNFKNCGETLKQIRKKLPLFEQEEWRFDPWKKRKSLNKIYIYMAFSWGKKLWEEVELKKKVTVLLVWGIRGQNWGLREWLKIEEGRGRFQKEGKTKRGSYEICV